MIQYIVKEIGQFTRLMDIFTLWWYYNKKGRKILTNGKT